MNQALPVGLDIGSLNSCICVFHDAQLFTLSDWFGTNQIPTCVAFVNQERLYGSMAREYFHENAQTTIYNFKRFIGKTFSEDEMTELQRTTPYKLEPSTECDCLQFPIKLKNKIYSFSPRQLLSMHLKYIKNLITNRCSSSELSCVIGIPICCTQEQKDALLSACQLAELNDVQLLEEPIAIATAYALREPTRSDASRHVAFVSIGYMHTQVAVCSFNKKQMKILGASSDSELGGFHFDQIIYDMLYETLEQSHQLELSKNDVHSDVCAQLISLLPTVKKRLNHECGTISVPITNPSSKNTINVPLSCPEFQKKSDILIKRLKEKLDDCLREAKLSREKIDAVELLGGTCQMMEVAKVITEVLGKGGNRTWSSNEAVATGCTFHAVWKSTNETVPLEILKSPGVLPNDLLNKYREENEQFDKLEEEEKEKQKNCNDLQEFVYSQMDAVTPEKFEFTFEDERQQYINELEKINKDIRSDGFGRTNEACNSVREELRKKLESFKRLSEKRREVLIPLLQLSKELMNKRALLQSLLNDQENLLNKLTSAVWSGKTYLCIQEVPTEMEKIRGDLTNAQWSYRSEVFESYTTEGTIPPDISNLPQEVIGRLLTQLDSIKQHQEALERALDPVYKTVLESLISPAPGITKLKLDKPSSFQQLNDSMQQLLTGKKEVEHLLPTKQSWKTLSLVKKGLQNIKIIGKKDTASNGSQDDVNECVKKFVKENWKPLCDTIDEFHQAWYKYAKIYSTPVTTHDLAKVIKELERAQSKLEKDVGNSFEQLSNMVTGTQDIVEAFQRMCNKICTAIENVRKRLKDDVRPLLRGFGEWVCYIGTVYLTDETKLQLDHLSNAQSEFTHITESFATTLEDWAKELPGYKALIGTEV